MAQGATGAETRSSRRRLWLVILLITLLWHVALFMPKVPWAPSFTPPRIDVETISPEKIEQLKAKWKQSLLIDKNPSAAGAAVPPQNARYFSDRNIRVEKETRATKTVVLPKRGQAVRPTPGHGRLAKPLPELSKLGLPFKIAPASTQPGNPEPEGGEQYVDDKQAAEGSQTLLNAQESTYYSFFSRVYTGVGGLWRDHLYDLHPQHLPPGNYVTIVDVVYDKDGNLVSVQHVQKSGVPAFEDLVDYAWKKLGRVRNVPKGLLDEKGQLHVGFSFTVQIGQGGFLPTYERFY